MKSIPLLLLSCALMLVALGGVAMPTVNAADGCVIPESGPWPPCATGGSSSGSSGGGCVIPEKGPWPPCATGGGNTPQPSPVSGMATVRNSAWVVHQGRGTKQSTLLVQGPQVEGRNIARVEVEIDFTYSVAACSADTQFVDNSLLGYALISPSGTRIDLFEAGQLDDMQWGARAKIRFVDGGDQMQYVASGRYRPIDSLSQLVGENPNGEWKIVITKNSFDYAVCQHSVALFITTTSIDA